MARDFHFKISDGAFLKFLLSRDYSCLDSYDEIVVIFCKNKIEHILYNGHAKRGITALYNKLQQALNNSLRLNDFINSENKNDIGYLFNEGISKHSLIFRPDDGNWSGLRYLVWYLPEVATWLYSKGNKIFLEITPLYVWYYNDPLKGKAFLEYSKFIFNYSPVVKKIFDKNQLLLLNKKLEELISIMEINDKK